MQFLNLILAVAAATASAAAVEKRLNFGKWCTGPYDSRGVCEDQGFKAYCCANDKSDDFTQNINVVMAPDYTCTVGSSSKGQTYCA
ncbi:hypothetical protein E4U21_004121 [Claviceps maximensis]|nr:hypothetical protein E4U21_004121 [Claviceps maximensis]